MSILRRICKSKIERVLPKNDIDKLIMLARKGDRKQRIQAYLHLANVIVDLLPDSSEFRESYRHRIIESAVAGMNDSEEGIQEAAKLAVAQQLNQLIPSDNLIAIQLRSLIHILQDNVDKIVYKKSTHLSQEQADIISSLLTDSPASHIIKKPLSENGHTPGLPLGFGK